MGNFFMKQMKSKLNVNMNLIDFCKKTISDYIATPSINTHFLSLSVVINGT